MTVCIIRRDAKTVGIASDDNAGLGVLAWFHHNHNQSMGYALEHDGYSVEAPADLDCGDVESVIAAICERADLTMESTFVPFSQSRNAKPGADGKPWRSLNWEVTIKRHGRVVLTTDYAQGEGHAPALKVTGEMRPGSSDKYARTLRRNAVSREIETGRCHTFGEGWATQTDGTRDTKKPIPAPSIGDVMQSLARDSDVLEYGDFDQWASEFGYDADSRKAESIYRTCVEIATKLRAGLGGHLLDEIRLAASFN